MRQGSVRTGSCSAHVSSAPSSSTARGSQINDPGGEALLANPGPLHHEAGALHPDPGPAHHGEAPVTDAGPPSSRSAEKRGE